MRVGVIGGGAVAERIHLPALARRQDIIVSGLAELDGHRLPIGLQLLGKPLDEARILQIAHAYEQSTDWHNAHPPSASILAKT